ncbi:MAG: glycoside hydrolase family 140 protein [Oscillospiraceae bacterium]|nr:glycoside hydrolase family 140 protein [Oscillospiraceae bacterium]
MQRLKIHENGRYIVNADGSQFFYMGDTAWELFHRLDRGETDYYLNNRAKKKFNVIQAVLLAEFEGLNVPNAYGRCPLLKNSDGRYDPAKPDESGEYGYWEHADYVVGQAASLGLYIGMLPTWGDKFNLSWGKGPEIFTPENAYIYGKWVGARYARFDNIIWILGGDRPLATRAHHDIINNMAAGIRDAGANQLMTYHPTGGRSSSEQSHHEAWLDFNMIQSGHDKINGENYRLVGRDYNLAPVKPTMDAEPRYEDHGVNFNAANGYFDDWDVRQALYWGVFSGACGATYGHHSVWGMIKNRADPYFPEGYFPVLYPEALDRPGAFAAAHLSNLMNSRDFLNNVPAQEIIAGNYSGAPHIKAIKNKNYAYIYSPCGLQIKIARDALGFEPDIFAYYNPRNGEYTKADPEIKPGGITEFTPPSSGRNNDWVLVAEQK